MRRALCVVVALSMSACFTDEQFYQMKVDASACSDTDACTLAGRPAGTSCTCCCRSPVRASEAANIDAAAGRVFCGGKMVECVPFANPRCEAGRCVAD